MVGNVIAQGSPSEIMKNKDSLTGSYLSGKKKFQFHKKEKKSKEQIKIIGATENNLKNIDVSIPFK